MDNMSTHDNIRQWIRSKNPLAIRESGTQPQLDRERISPVRVGSQSHGVFFGKWRRDPEPCFGSAEIYGMLLYFAWRVQCIQTLLQNCDLACNFGAVTASIGMSPCHQRSVRQDRNKCCVGGLKCHNTSEPILGFRGVAAKPWMTPSNNWSISKDGRKCAPGGLNCLYGQESMLDVGTDTAQIWVAPSHHRSICQNCSKCAVCSLNLVDIHESILDFRAVATEMCIAPGHYRSIHQDCSKGSPWSLKLLHTS